MTANFSVLQEGSTLIGDHKTTVQALEDILSFTDLEAAKKLAKLTLQSIGEPGYCEDDVHAAPATDNLTTR